MGICSNLNILEGRRGGQVDGQHHHLLQRAEDRGDYEARVRVQDLRGAGRGAALLPQLHQVVLLPRPPPGDLHDDRQPRAYPGAAAAAELHRPPAVY